MTATRSYLVCATPRSGSTLVCQALSDTRVAGRPEEYFEALRHSGRPRRDPLLDGPVAAPVGAQINDPSQVSPDEPTTTVRADPTASPSR